MDLQCLAAALLLASEAAFQLASEAALVLASEATFQLGSGTAFQSAPDGSRLAHENTARIKKK
jgi:hypothetical protein